jgi:hypothetical protein
MIGLYTFHREQEEGGHMPVTIYLSDVESIFAPTVGIPDFGNIDSDKYLFLFRRREEWPSAWDHFVQSCCKEEEEESLEPEYEEVVVEEGEDDDDDEDEVDDEDKDDDDDDDDEEEDDEEEEEEDDDAESDDDA